MNASKCMYTIFSDGGRGGINLNLRLFGEEIPYNPEPVFLGITFDERLCFNVHFSKLRIRALKRLNIIKIFSHRSWHFTKKTLLNVYRALIGSLFNYSFFTVSCVSSTNLKAIQTVQNRAIRCIYGLKWDNPTKDLFPLSNILFLRERFLQMGSRYIVKCFSSKNKFTGQLVKEYFSSWSAVTAKSGVTTTPLGAFYSIIRIAYACIALIRVYLIFDQLKISNPKRFRIFWILCKAKKRRLIWT
jgi:hypothetical protein